MTDAPVREFLAGRNALCPECGYNLRDCPSPLCPECGAAIDLARLIQPREPMPRNDLLVVAIVGMCGVLVGTVFLAPGIMGALGRRALPFSGLIVLGLILGEGWFLLRWLIRPRSFTRLARPLQWMLALVLGAPALVGIVGVMVVAFTILWGRIL